MSEYNFLGEVERGVNVYAATFLVLLTLKLCGVIDWWWGWVVAPLLLFPVVRLVWQKLEYVQDFLILFSAQLLIDLRERPRRKARAKKARAK